MPSVFPDSIPSPKTELSQLSDLSLDDFINRVINGAVELVINLVIAAAVFYAGKFIINKLYHVVERILNRRQADRSLTTFVLSLIRIVLFFILIVTVIGILGIETSSFLAIFASAGVAIGMALSGTLQNFAGGVLILLLKPYKIGDYIEAGGYAGYVTEIQIFNTIINTYDNKSIIIPNGGLSTGSINNWSREATRRVSWSVAISYGDSVDTAREAIMSIFEADNRIINDPEIPSRKPTVIVDELADSSVNLTARAWVASTDYWTVYYEINELIYKRLPQAGIHFPFPQLDVHLDR